MRGLSILFAGLSVINFIVSIIFHTNDLKLSAIWATLMAIWLILIERR